MAKYQAYAEYKDSGVEWLGEIPSHWDLYSLKRSVDKCTNGFWGGEPDGRNDLCVLRVADFNRDNFTINEDKLTLRSVLPKEAESRLLKKGDLLIEKSGGGEKTLVGCVVQFDKDFPAITSNFVAKMTPNVITDSKYLTYAFAHLYSGRVNFPSIKQTTGIQNLDSEAYLMEKFGFPSKNEQTQIASFLDHETAQIDTLIAKQEKLIELLKEKRQAVISHAVTKGLNPNVPMKDSGVEWLGEVPEHWGILPIKYLTESVNTGGTPKNPISFTDVDEVNWFTPGDFLNDLEITVSSKYVTFDSVNTGDSKLYPRGSVLMIGIGATLGKIAICNTEFSCNQQINVLVPNRSIISEYLAYALIIQMDQIKQLSNSSTIGIINQEKTKQIVIALPALDEQVKIVEKITQKLLGFKKIIDLSEEQVELLKERRTALISAAVTGKIDVRNWQAPTLAGAQTELSA